jgi:hypothetical protein
VDAGNGAYTLLRLGNATYGHAYTDGADTHWCGTFTNSTGAIELWRNATDVSASAAAVSAGTIAGANIVSASPLTLAGRPGATNRPLDGAVRDARTWQWKLTAAEIADVYAGRR